MPLPEAPATGHLPFEPPTQFPTDMTEFWGLWKQEKFWACHEALEDVWRAETAPARRRFLQGIIHCAVAVFQHRRGNATGAARQLLRAKLRLEPYLPEWDGLEVEKLLEGVQQEIAPSLRQEHSGLDELEQQLRSRLNS